MKILLTGGAGDLGQVLTPLLERRGDVALRMDIRPPSDGRGVYLNASILDRAALDRCLDGVESVVHIAAWHGIHEVLGQKDAYDFWDLNVTGTFNVFEAAARAGIRNVVFISSSSVYDRDQFYGDTKRLAEQVADSYRERHGLNVLTLRPRAFIPYWNRTVYRSYVEWARWFWTGAVHIDDVAQAVLLSLDLLGRTHVETPLALDVDGAYEYTEDDLRHWDEAGPGSTFRRHYPEFYDLAVAQGLDPAQKPTKLDLSETRRWLGYEPRFSLRTLLQELAQWGEAGPPASLP
jgi:nucleoside-diphosphate-sugar epimerase